MSEREVVAVIHVAREAVLPCRPCESGMSCGYHGQRLEVTVAGTVSESAQEYYVTAHRVVRSDSLSLVTWADLGGEEQLDAQMALIATFVGQAPRATIHAVPPPRTKHVVVALSRWCARPGCESVIPASVAMAAKLARGPNDLRPWLWSLGLCSDECRLAASARTPVVRM